MKRIIANVVVSVFIFSNVAFAYKPQANLWEERQAERKTQLASLPGSYPLPPLPHLQSATKLSRKKELAFPGIKISLPAAMTSSLRIRDVHKTKSPSTILLLEDIHQNKEAQENLSRALKALRTSESKKPLLVGLEGASGAFLYDTYKEFPDREIAREVADAFFEQGKISGPAHAGFTSYEKEGERSLLFWGVDDPLYYRKNVESYLEASPQKENAKNELSRQEKRLFQQKRTQFIPSVSIT